MSENIRSFRELKVWQKAMDLAMDVFEVTKKLPTEERYSLTSQIRRSSRSVPANITEAWRKRRYPAAFVSKLNDAEGEAAETQTHLEFCRRCGYLDEATVLRLDAGCEEVLAMLVAMSGQPEKWRIRRKDTEERRGDTTERRGDTVNGRHEEHGDAVTRRESVR